MRSFAGSVCGFITIVIYGIAVICGIIYHNVYTATFKSQGLEVKYTLDYYITWLAFLCIAAIISAIHHALWTIIDNQLELYSKLKEQNAMLHELCSESKKPENSNVPNGNDNRANIAGWSPHAPNQWTCSACGTVNTKNQCTNCGRIRD